MFKIKSKFYVLCAALFFLFGSATFTLEKASANDPDVPSGPNPCYHCGSIEACENGGQDYGNTGCKFDPDEYGTLEGCRTSDFYCQAIPGEG